MSGEGMMSVDGDRKAIGVDEGITFQGEQIVQLSTSVTWGKFGPQHLG
jgi:hypothetical protein